MFLFFVLVVRLQRHLHPQRPIFLDLPRATRLAQR